jgi:hypothetical protein
LAHYLAQSAREYGVTNASTKSGSYFGTIGN